MSNLTPATIQKGVCVLVDGGCLNNNRPISERSMYGSMTVFSDGKQIESSVGTRDEDGTHTFRNVIHKYNISGVAQAHASNNMAEVVMLRKAVEYVGQLVNRCEMMGKQIDEVLIISDSEWAISIVTGVYKLKAQNQAAFNNDLATLKHVLQALVIKGVTVTFQHVSNLWVKEILGH